jgi:hypothetical protein
MWIKSLENADRSIAKVHERPYNVDDDGAAPGEHRQPLIAPLFA